MMVMGSKRSECSAVPKTAVWRLPSAFERPREGFVDALVMWREL
jgi:hypothetical protein